MKQAFRSKLGLNHANVARLNTVNGIIEEYQAEGYRLTLRQLYYQLVSRDIVPNSTAEYAKLGNLLVKGRMAGIVDWNAIEDRIRRPKLPYAVADMKEAIQDTVDQYRLDRQEGQENYIELWVEKDALSGVLSRITEQYHVRLMVNRGYSSCTAMYDAYQRVLEAEDRGQAATILYLGDHDPSGLDMVRDIRDRLKEFGVEPDVVGIGLTGAQIKKYNPPANPAKVKDPRATEYIKEFGPTSWEVDALNPKVLNALVTHNIERLIDMETYEAVIAREDRDKRTLQKVANKQK